MTLFSTREEAGLKLAEKLTRYQHHKDVVVLGLARGGVVVAHALARKLSLPLDVIVVRKIGAPGQEELAIGAIVETGEGIFNTHIIEALTVSKEYMVQAIAEQQQLIEQRLKLYRAGAKALSLEGKIVIVTDDGIATGASMRVAIASIRSRKAKKIILAVPVAPPETIEKFKCEADEVICLFAPANFRAVGQFYRSFEQVSDDEIITLLQM